MAAVSYAGDTLPGHPPIPIARSRPRSGLLVGIVTAVVALVVAVAARAAANPGLIVDLAGAGLVVAGIAVWFGTGPALVAAGVALLAVHEFSATAPDGP